jgi:hypothetical protein
MADTISSIPAGGAKDDKRITVKTIEKNCFMFVTIYGSYFTKNVPAVLLLSNTRANIIKIDSSLSEKVANKLALGYE